MQRDQFVAAGRVRWQELEGLLQRGRRGNMGRLSGDEVLRLGRLYRAATSDLAIARRDFPHDRITEYLNTLVGRTHPLVYREPAVSLARIGTFIRYGFPAAYRESLPYIGLAFGLFALAALISALLVTYRPALADVLLPGGQAEQLRSVMEQHHLWMKSATENHSVAANFIMLNNIWVAFSAFAGGILLGVGTVIAMVYNGINIGAVAAMVAQYQLSGQLWSFVVPHGVIELSVIFMAGGAGLMLGDAILRPGYLRRTDALVAAARRAMHLISGCVPLLVVAGTIEGFFSPSDAPALLKYAVGAVEFAALYGYLLFSRPQAPDRLYTFEDAVPLDDARRPADLEPARR